MRNKTPWPAEGRHAPLLSLALSFTSQVQLQTPGWELKSAWNVKANESVYISNLLITDWRGLHVPNPNPSNSNSSAGFRPNAEADVFIDVVKRFLSCFLHHKDQIVASFITFSRNFSQLLVEWDPHHFTHCFTKQFTLKDISNTERCVFRLMAELDHF